MAVKHFSNEFAFDHVNSAGLNFAFKAMSTNFGSSCVIEALRVPRFFNAGLRSRHVRSRLSRMDQGANLQGAHVEMILPGNLREPQRIRRSRAHHRRSKVTHHVQTLDGILAAAGNHHRAYFSYSLNRGPEADERAERKR